MTLAAQDDLRHPSADRVFLVFALIALSAWGAWLPAAAQEATITCTSPLSLEQVQTFLEEELITITRQDHSIIITNSTGCEFPVTANVSKTIDELAYHDGTTFGDVQFVTVAGNGDTTIQMQTPDCAVHMHLWYGFSTLEQTDWERKGLWGAIVENNGQVCSVSAGSSSSSASMEMSTSSASSDVSASATSTTSAGTSSMSSGISSESTSSAASTLSASTSSASSTSPASAGSSVGTTPQCSDAIDNDGDTKTDTLDPGCYTGGFYNPFDTDESNAAGETLSSVSASSIASAVSSSSSSVVVVSYGNGGNYADYWFSGTQFSTSSATSAMPWNYNAFAGNLFSSSATSTDATGLTISVTDNRDTASAGETIRYSIRIE